MMRIVLINCKWVRCVLNNCMDILKIKLAGISIGLMMFGIVVADNKSYAEMVPQNIVTMAKGEIALIVEKATQTLFLYKFDGKFNLETKMKCSTGKLKGRKSKSGDRKTPEGVYFFTGKYFEKDLAPVYGAGAFPVDYPNQLDKEAGRTGYSIWLHGTDRKLKPRDSNGCVAIENHNIEKMQGKISLDYTPIVFLDRIEYVDTSRNTTDAEAINVLLEKWANALVTGTYHQYLSYYSPDYLPDIRWWGRWQKLKSKAENDFSVRLKKKSIYRDGDIYVVLLEEVIAYDGDETRTGVKKLYIAKENNGYKIRGENYKFIHYAEDNNKKRAPRRPQFITAAHKTFEHAEVKRVERLNTRLKAVVSGWVEDWSMGNIDDYSGYYSADFSSSGMDKQAWVDRKRYLSRVYKYIDVKISKVTIKHEKKKAYVSFQQQYKSSGYSADGSKTLVLVNEDKRWKIIQEIWKKN